jgi:UDP-N-acetylglucosamine 1-carboxyvinyltransferase
MSYFRIEGGCELTGVFTPAGNKNAALPILAGCLLTDEPVRLTNVPDIRDVRTMADLGSMPTWLRASGLRSSLPAPSSPGDRRWSFRRRAAT